MKGDGSSTPSAACFLGHSSLDHPLQPTAGGRCSPLDGRLATLTHSWAPSPGTIPRDSLIYSAQESLRGGFVFVFPWGQSLAASRYRRMKSPAACRFFTVRALREPSTEAPRGSARDEPIHHGDRIRPTRSAPHPVASALGMASASGRRRRKPPASCRPRTVARRHNRGTRSFPGDGEHCGLWGDPTPTGLAGRSGRPETPILTAPAASKATLAAGCQSGRGIRSTGLRRPNLAAETSEPLNQRPAKG